MFLIFFICAQWGMENYEAKCFRAAPSFQYPRAESTHAFNVLKYELDVNVPMTERSIQGTNKIACRSRIDGLNTATLHSYTLTIDSVLVDGTNVTYSVGGESLLIDLLQTYNTGDSFNIEIGYHGSWNVSYYQTGFVYYPKNYNSNTLHSLAYTLGEPWDARRWMPCYDEPYDKADYGCVISVTVPDTFTVCANGELIGATNNSDATTTYTWEEHYPITTYLMHFGVSRYAVWSQWYYSLSGDSIETRHFVWPEDSAQSVTSFQYLPMAMELFDSLYGSYPFDRYGQDVVYPYSWGGMEHQEISTINRSWVLNQSDRGMAHELAHMWWGDMVTCVDFRNIWLNEGCATYSDANYIWYRLGHSDFISLMQNRTTSYFQSDQAWRHPLYDPPPSELFDYGHTYCKASWVMHMLRYLDQNNFFPAMQVYRDSFEYSTVNTEDLKSIFSQVYGIDLTWFFDEWVYDQGYPEYDIFWHCAPSGSDYLAVINIYQTQTNAPSVFHMPVQIMLHMTGGDTLVDIPVTSSPEYAEFTVSDSVTSIDFDPDYWLLKKYYIYYGIEEIVNNTSVYNDILFSSNPSSDPEITYVLNQSGEVRVTVYDVSGRVCSTIYNGVRKPGHYTVRVQHLPAGIYFCRLETPVNERVRKLVIID